MADNELYMKLVLSTKDAIKDWEKFNATIGGKNVNVAGSKKAFDAIRTSLGESSGAAKVFAKAIDEINKGTPSLRYAMYDIRSTMLGIAAASAALAVSPLAFSIKYERNFANVIRTNELAGQSLETFRDQLRSQLREIAQTTPISWEDITNIATLAGQLGVAQEVVADFTETVAKFSATTDLTVDAAATAFGRLDQLIKGIDGNFEGLGSAILAVGVDSVATESQIVNVSTQIASMGNLAGLTAPEIVGLSGAIASLGIRPELARGNITRLFSNIGKSAAEGGYNVEEFGRLTGRTADEFVADWSTRPGDVLQDFFDGINEEGPRAERTLRQLGITSVRDIPAILRLAQNADEVRRLIALSNDEYVLATKVTEQYGIISNTTAEQLNRLQQNFQTLLATIGDGIGPLSATIGLVNLLVQGFISIAESPVGQFFSGVAIASALVVSAITALVGIFAGVVASFLAASFASQRLGFSLGQLFFSALKSKAAVDALTASSAASTVAVSALGAAIRVAFLATGVGAVILGIVTAIGLFAESASKAEDSTTRFFGNLNGLEAAVKKDTEAFLEAEAAVEGTGEAIRKVDRQIVKSANGYESVTEAAREYADANAEVATAVGKASSEIENQTFVLGEATAEYFKGALLEDADIVQAFADPEFQRIFTEGGANISELITRGIEGTGGEYIDEIVSSIKDRRAEIQSEYNQLNALSFRGFSEEESARFRELRSELAQYDKALAVVEGDIKDFITGQEGAVVSVTDTAIAVEFLNGQLDTNAEKTNIAEGEIKKLLGVLFDEADYIRGVEKALDDYAEALAKSSDQGEAAQKVVEKIFADPTGDVNVILGNLGAYLTLLELQEQQGIDTAISQEIVRRAINSVGEEAGLNVPDLIAYAQGLRAIANFDSTNFDQILADAFDRVGDAAGGAAAKVKTLSERFDELVSSIFEPVNAARSAAESIADLGESYAELGDGAFFASEEIQDAVSNILDSASTPEEGISNLNALFNELASTVGSSTAPSLQFLRSVIDRVANEFGVASSAIGQATIDLSFFERGVRTAQEEVRTLGDYAGDIGNVITRAFDIRFASTFDIDRIAGAWFDLTEQVEDAQYAVEELIATQQDLGADRALKEYFLSVADAYGDTLRAAQLRKEIAALDREQAQNARELVEAQQIAGGDLTTQGPGARQNRAALLDLVRNYQDYITSLAESGASTDELRQATADARQEFINQATELGFHEEVVLEYAQAFDDVTFAINNVPRDITVNADTNPAIQALNELNAKLNESIDLARELNRTTGEGVTGDTGGADAAKAQRRQNLVNEINRLTKVLNSPQGGTAGRGSLAIRIQRLRDQLASGNYATGGFTGRGGRMEPAGIVHRGEYVVPKQYVNQSSGLPNAQFLAQLQNGMRGYAQGGFVGGGMAPGDAMMVELSPYDRKLLQDAGNVQLRVNGRILAETTNTSNYNEARRGSN
jgi:TP901 family phage tail tape measure protein